MKIDTSRTNLTEKDIEDWLYGNPKAVETYMGPIKRWIARQYRLPSGIADLIGLTENDMIVVVEVKNVAINKAAVLQVCRYAADIQQVLELRESYPFSSERDLPVVCKVLIGPSIDAQTFDEASACNVWVMQFAVTLQLDLSDLHWPPEHSSQVRDQLREVSFRPEWERFGRHMDEVHAEMQQKAYEERYRQEYLRSIEREQEKDREQDEYDQLMDAAITASLEESDTDAPF